jgi:hypothetical protein
MLQVSWSMPREMYVMDRTFLTQHPVNTMNCDDSDSGPTFTYKADEDVRNRGGIM